jgi:non-specific serine/threonine protein kinase/serine/threonine-protein kinase
MGEVWLAEQMEPVNRQVALKLIKAGMDTVEVVARFQHERQAMALMDHPSIAKVLDAGSTPQGRPYFAMEYIAGTAITVYCDNRKLSLSKRIELFAEVCDAVQHAHQKAVIHRDLKPSNILVSEIDGRAMPHIIDFGVAKAMSHSFDGRPQVTRVGIIVGTPAYMSPEQANSEGVDVDTRTDVYSLGAVLYELLTGFQPLDLKELTLAGILERLRLEDPASPSAKVKALAERAGTVARDRNADPKTLFRELQGDLDAIVLKALEKDRSRRYASPSDLAGDLRRCLRQEAVLAVAPSRSYRLRKFVRRFRTPIAVAASCLLTLILASALSVWQSIRAIQQRDRADVEAATAKAVNDFLQKDLLAQASTDSQLGMGTNADPDLKVRTVLDRAAAQIGGRFERQPSVEAAIRETIAETYSNLGLANQSRIQFQRVYELRRASLGPEDPATLDTASSLAVMLGSEGNYQQAVNQLVQILKTQNRLLGPEHRDSLLTEVRLGSIYRDQGKYPQAEEIFRHQSQHAMRVWGREDPRTLVYLDRLADICYRQGKYDEAERLDRQVLDSRLRVSGPDHIGTTVAMSELALVYGAKGQFALELELENRILETRRRVQGPESPATIAAMNNLAITNSYLGKNAVAERLNLEAFGIRSRVLGPEHPETMMSMENLACSYADLGKFSLAEATFRRALEIDRRTMGNQSRFTIGTLSDEAFLFQREGKFSLAERDAAEALSALRQSLGSQNAVTIDAVMDLATTQISQGKAVEALLLAREAVAYNRKSRADSWQRYRGESLLGRALAMQSVDSEAEPHLVAGYQGMLSREQFMPAEDRYYLQLAQEWHRSRENAPRFAVPAISH